MLFSRVSSGLACDRLGWLPPPESSSNLASIQASAQRSALPPRQLFRCNSSMQKPQRRVMGSTGWAGLDDVNPSSNTSRPSFRDATSSNLSDPSEDSSGCSKAEMMQLINMLPSSVRATLQEHPQMESLVEIVMDLGRVPFARFASEEAALSSQPVSEADLAEAVQRVGDFGDDNRAGIDRTLHRISCMRNRAGKVVGLTCRVGRAVRGSAAIAADLIRGGSSILLLGRPGVGKTTAIRDITRMLAEDCLRRVIIVDTSNEIGGDGDIPHAGVGPARRIQVPHGAGRLQHRVMVEAVENHMPEVIVIDEIGTEAEALAARTVAQRGVQLIATAHGNSLENVMKNPALQDLVGGLESVTLGDEEARRRGVQKSVLERAAPPTFDVAIEIIERGRWRVHTDVGEAVDQLLRGQTPTTQVRSKSADGTVIIESEEEVSDAEDEAQGSSKSSFGASEAVPGHTSFRNSIERLEPDVPRGPPPHALQVYLFGIDEGVLRGVMTPLGLAGQVWPTDRLQDAHAVLALRTKLTAGGWVRQAAKDAGVPIYAVKTSSPSNLLRALRTLLGIDPSAGGTFARRQDDDDERDSFQSDALAAAAAGTAFVREKQPPAPARPAPARPVSVHGNVVSRAVAENRNEALEEARLAVEQIVLRRKQPIELLPRSPDVILLQIKLVEEYVDLGHETVGVALNSRLRILPAVV